MRPKSAEEFIEWSDVTTCGAFSKHTQTWYESAQNNLFTALQQSEFLAQLNRSLEQAGADFRVQFGVQLFALGVTPNIVWNKKPYASFVEKLFRYNCLENELFPSSPADGWGTLDSAFAIVDDVVRTTVYVAYADGVKFLADKIDAGAASKGLSSVHKDHAKEKGYYAHHLYLPMSVPVASLTTAGEYTDQQLTIEVQIATQLQGALREVTHFLYEKERVSGGPVSDWKHEFSSGRFRAAYMAHSLRFIEAMIIELRKSVALPGTEHDT